jgi:hypothetical protein
MMKFLKEILDEHGPVAFLHILWICGCVFLLGRIGFFLLFGV